MKKLLFLSCFIGSVAIGLGQGFYLEFKMTAGAKTEAMNGTMKSFSQDGNARSEITMSSPAMPGGNMNLVSITLKAEPKKVYLLNQKDKTYSEMDVNGADEWEERAQADYEVTVIGKETVNGYNTTHVSIKINGKATEELWTTKDIAGYAELSQVKTKYTGKANMYKALAAKGADGMPVRIKADEHGHSMQLDLVKAEKRNNPASLFSLTGYTKSSRLSIPGMENMPGMKEMMEKVKNMTPQEREEMLKHLQQQYGEHAH